MPRPSTAVAEVRDAIRTRITAGGVEPGQRLVERTLADELGVSRVPVREALRQLVAEGFVTERATGGMVPRHYTPAEIDELVAVNAALEAILVRAWTETCDPAALDRLDDALDAAAAALAGGDRLAAVEANAAFHAVLTTQGPLGITRELLAAIGPRLRWLQRQHVDAAAMHAEHQQLVRALRAGDAEVAVELIRQHAATSRSAVDDLSEHP